MEKGIQKSMLTNYQEALCVLDHSTSARDREKRKLFFVYKIFIILLNMSCVFSGDKETRVWGNE